MRTSGLLLLALLAACVVGLTGCNSEGSAPVSDQTKTQTDRLTKIRQDSGGDWNKVSQEDKDWLIKDVCFGNENSAKMMIAPPPRPGGPPAGGPAKGAAPSSPNSGSS